MTAMLDWLRYQLRKLLRPRVISVGGVKLDLGDVARTRYARSFYRGDHERAEREIISRHLDADDMVLELGAGMGLVTIECCRRVGSDRVCTFEANPTLEPLLRRNFALNGVSPRLEMRMAALDAGSQEFHIADRFVLSSRHAAATEHKHGTSSRTRVDSVPLPRILTEVRPTFLIVDIEGGETDLAADSVRLEGVQKICIEMHPHIIGDDGVSRVAAALMAKGFQLCVGESRGAVLYFERTPQTAAAAETRAA